MGELYVHFKNGTLLLTKHEFYKARKLRSAISRNLPKEMTQHEQISRYFIKKIKDDTLIESIHTLERAVPKKEYSDLFRPWSIKVHPYDDSSKNKLDPSYNSLYGAVLLDAFCSTGSAERNKTRGLTAQSVYSKHDDATSRKLNFDDGVLLDLENERDFPSLAPPSLKRNKFILPLSPRRTIKPICSSPKNRSR